MTDQTPKFSIKAVSERTGVSTHTLRAWERRYGIPKPSRGIDNRYRFYDEQDIADVLWLKHQVESGISPAQAATLRREGKQPGAVPESAAPLEELRDGLVSALAASNEPVARQVLDQIATLFTPEQVALQIVEPAMQELGARWQRNEIHVWQEHLATNLIRQRILSLIQAQPDISRTGRTLMAACPPEEQHELGLMLFALLARRQGWRVEYLGQRTPISSIVPLLRENRWAALSVTTPMGLASLLPLWRVPDLPRERLLFGGYLPNQLPRLQEHLPGVFLGVNPREALHVLGTREPRPNQWTPGKRALRAGLDLQGERLKLGWQTIEALGLAHPGGSKGQPRIDPQVLTTPSLFLADALASALVLDVPELLDMQAHWLGQVLPVRGVGIPLINRYLAGFRQVVERSLEPETAGQVLPLLDRLKLAPDSAVGENDR